MIVLACPCRHYRDVVDAAAAVAVAVAFAVAVTVVGAAVDVVVVVVVVVVAAAVDGATNGTMAFHRLYCHCCTKVPVAVVGKRTAVIATVAVAYSVAAAATVVLVVAVAAVTAADIRHRPYYAVVAMTADSCHTA